MKAAWIGVPLAAAAAALSLVARQPSGGHARAHARSAHGAAEGPRAAGMRTPTVAAAADGTIWRVWVEDGHVLASSSTDLGRTYGTPVRVTREAAEIDANGEGRPKVALGPGGEIYVTYTRSGRRPFTGDVQFSRSLDGGRTFEPPRTLNDDGLDTGHRFDALAVAPDGAIYVVWVDKRDLERALQADEPYRGAALYYTVSRDRGATFAPNRKIKDYSCECCRIAHAFDARGRLALFWRDVMEGSIRDHAMTWIEPGGRIGPIRRVTADNWTIDACPHHGPSLALAADGTMHVVWFTGESPRGPGAFYGRLDPEGRLLGEPRRLGPPHPGTGHADVRVAGGEVTIVWKESRRDATVVMAMTSRDGGISFDRPRQLAAGSPFSDHPLLVSTPAGLYVSWYDGGRHRMLSLGPARAVSMASPALSRGAAH